MKMWGCDIDDSRIINMDPVRKIWMYNNWIADQNDLSELAKNHAYLLGSFWNPEAVKNLMGDGNVHISSDDEYEESLSIVKNQNFSLFNNNNNNNATSRKRRRKKISK